MTYPATPASLERTKAHTPGPWRQRVGDLFTIVERDEEGMVAYRVAHVINSNGYEQNEANARLIAAAPELLAALQEAIHQSIDFDGLVEADTGPQHWLAQARAAIAKATGATK